MGAAENKAIVVKFFEAISSGDVARILGFYAEDGVCQTMGRTLISGKFSKAQISAAAARVFDVFPKGVTFELLTLTAEDDRVAVEAVSHGDHISGKHYSNHYHFLVRLRDGKVTLLQEFMDTELVTDILCGGQRPAPISA
ncbi:MAG: nuclear transport factor 2 family protein [Rhodospirillaceae bacterium]|nr:nuclear transport factor 2 family protein [Rhodospirillaceae bacterium]